MTPQQAVDRLVRTEMSTRNRDGFLSLFKKVATTARDNATRRCADYVRDDRGLNWLADDLLRTGGLKVEDGSSQTDNHG